MGGGPAGTDSSLGPPGQSSRVGTDMPASLLGPRLTQVGSWVQVPAGPLSWSDFGLPSPHPPEDGSSPGGLRGRCRKRCGPRGTCWGHWDMVSLPSSWTDLEPATIPGPRTIISVRTVGIQRPWPCPQADPCPRAQQPLWAQGSVVQNGSGYSEVQPCFPSWGQSFSVLGNGRQDPG